MCSVLSESWLPPHLPRLSKQAFCMHMLGAHEYQALTGSPPLSCDLHLTQQNSYKDPMQHQCTEHKECWMHRGALTQLSDGLTDGPVAGWRGLLPYPKAGAAALHPGF